MASIGYSGTPLIKKLGIKPGYKLLLLNEPAEYPAWLGMDPVSQFVSKKELPDFIHLFAKDKKSFETQMKKLDSLIQKKSTLIIWVSWYKKSSGVETDLTENIIRSYALKNGLVDVKVCAVSEEWSGLKLVVPLAMRKP